MKADYKNWMPKGMVVSTLCGCIVSSVLAGIVGLSNLFPAGTLKMVLTVVLIVAAVVLAFATAWMWLMYRAFSYTGKRQMARDIIEKISAYVTLPDGGKGLDVGCGSGALTIACAKRNHQGQMTGIDRWGKEYASYNKPLCENNAKAEGVSNVSFAKGNAVKLEFPDESFDAVTSNYVYHNIPSLNRQAILMETLRVLKKGGTFAIHDIFSKQKYGNMALFVEKLRAMGYTDVRLIDTTDGSFITPKEARLLSLTGSALLVGKK